MRRSRSVTCLVGLLGLLASACASGDSSTVLTSAAVAGTTVPPTTAAAPRVEPAPSGTEGVPTPAGSLPAGAAVRPTAPLVPVAVCVTRGFALRPGSSATSVGPAAGFLLEEDSVVVFGYVNDAGAPVVVPAGPGNQLVGDAPDDDPLVPVAFATGSVTRAFAAYVGRDGTAPEWRLTGPDGVSRRAAPSVATPPCTQEQLGFGPVAESPEPTFTYRSVRGADGAPTGAELRVGMVGLPALSTCAAGLTRLPPVARAVVSGQDRALGEPVTVNRSGPVTFAYVEVHVADVCEADGVRSASWAAGAAYDQLREGAPVCLLFQADGVALARDGEVAGCARLPATGGIRSRRVTIAP